MAGKRAVLAVLAAACLAAGKTPEPAKPVTRPCDVRAYVIDEDPKGLNVRSEPNAKSKILGALPPMTDITIVGVQGGWLRIGSAESEIVDTGEMVTGLPQSGWISRRLVGTDTRNYAEVSEYFLHEAPDKKSKVVTDPREAILPIVDCDGAWVKVEAKDGKAGWLEPGGQCANWRTNCS